MLDDPHLDLCHIPDPETRRALEVLRTLVETLAAENRSLREEHQRRRDDNTRLTGEHGQPPIKPNNRLPTPAVDHSSAQERRVPRPHQKGTKLAQVTIDRTSDCPLDPASLPPDADCKGYEEVVVQDLGLRTDNLLFRKEKGYAPSTRQTYRAPLPDGYAGAYGPQIKALAIVLADGTKVSQPQILDLFHNAGILSAAGTRSDWLNHAPCAFHAENDAIVVAGLRSSPWQQIDDPPTRVNGQNEHCQGLCNPLSTASRTTPPHERLPILDVLRGGQARVFRLNDAALAYLDALGLAQITRQGLLPQLPWNCDLDEPTMRTVLAPQRPPQGPQTRKWVLAATAIAAYHAHLEWPIVRLLLCADAPPLQCLTDDLALGWVQEGRHSKKLPPCLPHHRQVVAPFLTRFGAFYRELLAYQARPDPHERQRVDAAFDALFGTGTG